MMETTPTPALRDLKISISISDSPNLGALGLSKEHLDDAMTEMARHLLALGAHLAYGGDLRNNGFTVLLFELALRYGRGAGTVEGKPPVTNYLPWPVHMSLPRSEIEERRKYLEQAAALICLDRGGQPTDRMGIVVRNPSSNDWEEGLSAMRRWVTSQTDARIVLGGSTTNYKGVMPGVAEETLWSLKFRKPVYVLGGFGGCASEVAKALGLSSHHSKSQELLHEPFKVFKPDALRNGLSRDENEILARTVHVDEMMILVLRGLLRKFSA